MVGDAGHADRRARRGAARRQGDVEQACGLFRVVVEQLVKIAHPVKEQDVRVLGLDAKVLLHHRGMVAETGVVQALLVFGKTAGNHLYRWRLFQIPVSA